MAFIVLCGKANTAPDRIVGLFDSEAEAQTWATAQPDQPGEVRGGHACLGAHLTELVAHPHETRLVTRRLREELGHH